MSPDIPKVFKKIYGAFKKGGRVSKIMSYFIFVICFGILLILLLNFLIGSPLSSFLTLESTGTLTTAALLGAALSLVVIMLGTSSNILGMFGGLMRKGKGAAGKAGDKTGKAAENVGFRLTIMMGGLLALFGLVIMVIIPIGGGAFLDGPVKEGIIFMALGIDFFLAAAFLKTKTGVEGGQATSDGISWKRMLGFSIGITAVTLILLSFLFQPEFIVLVNIALFMVFAKIALMMIYVALGLKMEKLKEGVSVSESLIGPVLTSFFMGIVAVIAIIAVLFPAYYLWMYTGGAQISTLMNVQNPMISEFVNQVDSSAGASMDVIQTIMGSLIPSDFEKIVVEVDALTLVGVSFWSGFIGMPLVDTFGREITVPEIIITEILLVLVMSIAVLMVSNSKIGFQKIKDSGEINFVYVAYKRMWKKLRKN